MASMASSSNLLSDELEWVIHVRRAQEEELEDADDLPISISCVPKPLLCSKPQCYVPQSIALGPYHHRRCDLHEMERFKLSDAKRSQQWIPGFKFQNLVDLFSKLEYPIRAHYHRYLNFNGDTLAWMMAIDASFLLEFLQDETIADQVLGSMLLGFLKEICPFEVVKINALQHSHLLEVIYYSIVPRTEDSIFDKIYEDDEKEKQGIHENCGKFNSFICILIDFLSSRVSALAIIVFKFLVKIPWSIVTKFPMFMIIKQPLENLFSYQMQQQGSKDNEATKDSQPLVEEIAILMQQACRNPQEKGQKTRFGTRNMNPGGAREGIKEFRAVHSKTFQWVE